MANTKIKATAQLFLDVSDAQSDAKKFVTDLKKQLSSIETAADKITIFKDLVGYIAQVDKALTALQAKNSDAFKHMFDGMDAALRKQLEDLFGVSGDQLGKFDVLQEKLATLTPKSGIAELRKFAKEINALYASVGMDEPLNIEADFTKVKASQKQIDLLTNACGNFATVWKDISAKLKNGFSFGEAGESVGDGVVSGVQDAQKKVTVEFDKLKNLIKKKVEEVFDAQANGVDEQGINAITRPLYHALGYTPDDQEFWDIEDIFEQLEKTGDTKEAIKAITEIAKKKQELNNAVADAADQASENQNGSTSSMAEDVKEDAKETVDAIGYAKKQITKAWQEYYNAVQKAKANGINVTGMGSTTEMLDIEDSIMEFIEKSKPYATKGENKHVDYALINGLEKLIKGNWSPDDIEKEVGKIFDENGVAFRTSLDEMINETTQLQSGMSNVGSETQETSQEISSGMDQAENKIEDVSAALQKLIDYVSQYVSTTGKYPFELFNGLQSGAIALDDELKKILQSLNLINSQGSANIKSISSGYVNKGGFVSDEYTLISRSLANKPHLLKKAQEIQPLLQEAKDMGAQVGTIVEIFHDAANQMMYEIQKTAPGTNVYNSANGTLNQDILGASGSQINDLIKTIDILTQKGLFIDWGGDNVLYDKNKGFSIIDLGNAGGLPHTASVANTLQENLDRLMENIFQFSSNIPKDLINKFGDQLYSAAINAGHQITNPYAGAAAKQQGASQATTASIQTETAARKQSANAINEENAALQAQIELKKKAQSMTWGEFALDESLSGLKSIAGLTALGDMEAFWKKSNYEKPINFHELSSEADADAIIEAMDKKYPGLREAWYGGKQDFNQKTFLENAILADDDLWNAAMNKMWYIYQKYTGKDVGFEDFINNEYTVYKGTKSYTAPIIVNSDQKPSFSFKKSKAQQFAEYDGDVSETKIIPKHTVGNASTGLFESEAEIFIPSEYLPQKRNYIHDTKKSFDEYYNELTPDIQKELDKQLLKIEKLRVEDLLGKDLAQAIDNQGLGAVPNDASETVKKLANYYMFLSDAYENIPYQGKFHELAKSGLLNMVAHDEAGLKQHIAELTGESSFDIYGQSASDVNAEAAAHQANAQAMQQEAVAQQTLNDTKKKLSGQEVQKKLVDMTADMDPMGKESYDIYKLFKEIGYFNKTSTDAIAQGIYIDQSTGEVKDISDISDLISKIVTTYGENLEFVKDYLQQVLDDAQAENPATGQVVSYDDVKKKVFGTAQAAGSADPDKYHDMIALYNQLYDVNVADASDIANGMYTDINNGEMLLASDLLEMINRIENRYGENLQYVKDYLQQVFGKLDKQDVADELDVRIDDDGDFTFGDDSSSVSKYNVRDYDNAYAAESASAQKAIDDLALFYQKYKELQAKMDTEEINIMFHGMPTLDEQKQVLSLFEEFKAKQKEIGQLDLIDTDEAKQKVQELQAEVVGLQNQLRGAALDSNATAADYQSVYGLASHWDAYRFKNLVNTPDDIYDVSRNLEAELEARQEQTLKSISSSFASMLDDGTEEAVEEFLLKKAKSLQSQSTANDNSLESAQQELQVEQEITAEKQKQATLDDSQAQQLKTETLEDQDAQAEVAALDPLLAKVNDVKQAIDNKTQAFQAEGVAVDQVVQQEIASLNKLKGVLDEIQNSLQVIFNADEQQLSLSQEKINGNTTSGVLQTIQQTLEQILSVLQGFTGLESDHKDSISKTKPVVNEGTNPSDAYQLLASKLPDGIATESTLSKISNDVGQLVQSVGKKDSSDGSDISEGFQQLVSSLSNSVKVLQDVANGIIRHQEAQKTDTSVAMAKIADPNQYKQISDIAENSVGSLGSEVQIKSLKALADGMVQVEGAFKNAQGQWEGFTVNVNESNVAVDLAINKQSAYAKALNQTSEALKQQKIQDNAKLDTILEQSKELYKSLKINPLDTSDSANAVRGSYTQLIEELKKYKEKKTALTEDELNGLRQIYAQLMANAQAYAEQNKNADKTKKKTYGANVMTTATSKHNALMSAINGDESLASASTTQGNELQAKLAEYKRAYEELEAVYNRLKTINPTENDQAEFKNASAACNNLRKEVEGLIKSYQKMHGGESVVNEIGLDDDFVDKAPNRTKALQDYVESMYGAKAQIGDFKNNYHELLFTIDNGNGTFTEAKVAIDTVGRSLVETAGDTKTATSRWGSFVNELKGKFRSISTYLMSMTGIQEVWQQIRQGVQYVREIDAALTELKKVTDETDATYDAFLQTMSKTAGNVGSTVSELTTMAAEWARLGYDIEDAGKLAESTAILLNVSEFSDATEASQALISTMQAFGYVADDSQHVVDILNEVGFKMPKLYSNI